MDSLTDSVDVLHGTGGKVIVKYKINSLEVDASGEQSRANQNPNLPWTKTVDNVVSLDRDKKKRTIKARGTCDLAYCVRWYLLLCPFRMDHIHIDALVNQLMEKLSSSFFGLYKYQHGRQKTLKMPTGHVMSCSLPSDFQVIMVSN